MLHSVTMRRGYEDQLWWASFKRGLFIVKSFYSSLASPKGRCFPWKGVWHTPTLSRVIFFVQSAALSKILTLDNLRRRHVIVMDRCCMCKSSGEFVDYLLLHCNMVSTIWSTFFNRFGLSRVMPRQVINLYDYQWSFGRSRSAVV